MKRKRMFSITLILAGLVLTASANLSNIQAQFGSGVTLTVNSTADRPDVSPGNGICADVTGKCTLRAAIEEANALFGPDVIQFNIGVGTPTITPMSELPEIRFPVTINGNTGGATKVELNGSMVSNGLFIRGSGTTIRNMVINRCHNAGIMVLDYGDNKFEGNFIGTDASGTVDLGNRDSGIVIFTANDNIIGGTTPGAGNVISGNDDKGVDIITSSGTRIEGNFIGTKADGSSPLPNTFEGVRILGFGDNIIGGPAAGASNIIAFNGTDGVAVLGTANRIQANSIFSNGDLGIDVGGPPVNDHCDPDSGPNSMQNFPVIASATATGGNVTITGLLDSIPGTEFTIEFFSNSTADPSGFGEGQTFLGSVNINTSGLPTCTAAFAATLPVSVPIGSIITATATNNASNETSEFSLGFVLGMRTPFDFDADTKSDLSVWRPSTGTWFITNSSNSSTASTGWGVNGDQIVPGDYDRDNKTDTAVWQPSTGVWFIINSSNGSNTITSWGVSGDLPVPGDYDKDGKIDLAVWRPSSGMWFIKNSSDGSTSTVVWGMNGDAPATGDYDGDGKSDIAIWRPSSGTWFIINSSNGSTSTVGWGVSGDKLVAGDYDGDGKTDIAVWRQSTGVWFIIKSSDGSTSFTGWGVSTDVAVPGDYDGDGKTDIAVWRPSSGTWFIINSSDGSASTVVWGANGDVPVPSAYVRP